MPKRCSRSDVADRSTLAGGLASFNNAEEIVALAALVVVGGSLRLVLSHRKDRSILAYVMDNFWLWTSFGVGVTLASGYIGEESIVYTVMAIVIASVVGALFVKHLALESPVDFVLRQECSEAWSGLLAMINPQWLDGLGGRFRFK